MRKFIFNNIKCYFRIFVLFLLLITFGKSFCYVPLPFDVLSFDRGQEEILFNWLDSNLIIGDFAIKFNKGRLDFRQVSNLIDLLKGSYKRVKIRSIDFSNIEFINESDLIRIVQNLPGTRVLMLDLSNHFFSRKLITQLIEFIPKSNVRILKCLKCSIDDDKAKRIAGVFSRKKKLFFINLANNNIGDVGAKALISINCPDVVNLNNNNITDRGIIDIVNSIIEGGFLIKSLLVARNKFGNIGVSKIFKKLKKFPKTFGQIDLSGTHVTDDLLDSFSGQEGVTSADEMDMYVFDESIDNRVGLIKAVFGSGVLVVIKSWDRYLSPDIYEFIKSAINSEFCLLDEYPWLGEE